MNTQDLIRAIHRLKVETGSLACFGCGYEHSCSVRGCAILRSAAAALAKNQWINVKDRLPEIGLRVLTLDKWGHIHDRSLYRFNSGFLSFRPDGLKPGKDVTHWMPLPHPPKGE